MIKIRRLLKIIVLVLLKQKNRKLRDNLPYYLDKMLIKQINILRYR